MIADDYNGTNPIGQNTNQLILNICGDRDKDETTLTIEKNNVSVSIIIGSTWQIQQNENIYIYMGVDAIHNEEFVLSGIVREDQICYISPTSYLYLISIH